MPSQSIVGSQWIGIKAATDLGSAFAKKSASQAVEGIDNGLHP
jgi:hypothetical protein